MDRIESNGIAIVNPSDRDWSKHRYILALGAYGWTKLMVWSNSLEDAFDLAIEWCANHAPGLLATEQVREAYQEALQEALQAGEEPDTAHETAIEVAETDTISDSNREHYLLSWEAQIMAEDPSRQTILDMMRRT